MAKHNKLKRLLSLLLAITAVLSLFSFPVSASTLNTSASVLISSSGRHEYLYKSSGGTLGGSNWDYLSNDGIRGTAYCVNWVRS